MVKYTIPLDGRGLAYSLLILNQEINRSKEEPANLTFLKDIIWNFLYSITAESNRFESRPTKWYTKNFVTIKTSNPTMASILLGVMLLYKNYSEYLADRNFEKAEKINSVLDKVQMLTLGILTARIIHRINKYGSAN